MDLFLELGRFKTIPEMLDTLDCVEYDFLLEKYRKMAFGPAMQNHQMAQIAWAVVNSVSKKPVKFERFIMGELGDPEITTSDGCAVSMMSQDYYEYYVREGLSEADAHAKALVESKKYAENLRQKRIEEELELEQKQDLSNA